ncbi:MAG: hypothetical protein WC703_06135 [Candidatus Neomarinimicrobiota bacterium]
MIPKVTDLISSSMTHRFGDVFNPPGLTNFVGTVQADIDLTGIRSLNFPPFGTGQLLTAGLFLDGWYFPATGTPVTFYWRPDKIVREAEYRGLFLHSETVLLTGKNGVIIRLKVENRSGADRIVETKFGVAGAITKTLTKWNSFIPPSEEENIIEPDPVRSAVIFKARNSQAVQIQGVFPFVEAVDPSWIAGRMRLAAGETKVIYYMSLVGDDPDAVIRQFDEIRSNPDAEIRKTEEDWNAELQAVFTPGNSRYSGYLPTLFTDDKEILKLYLTGILSVIYFKRDNPYSVYGRAYDTLMPRYWQTTTFIWDYHLSQLVHSLLDPDVMQKYLEHWMMMDMHHHFGSDYLTGGPVGPWYSVNDYAMLSMSSYLLRWNGRMNWLGKTINGSEINGTGPKKVLDHLQKHADSWNFFKSKHGLADYGGINNLLECVSTYIHEVASLNAGNVFNLRFMADLLDLTGKPEQAQKYRREATALLPEVQKLYKNGSGFWHARFPDGKLVEVRHCYDFFTTINTIGDDLTATQKAEMFRFFNEELKTETWIRAMSPLDDNTMFSARPDHQWNGGYPAWPPQAAGALYKIGRGDVAFEWLKGVARSANQGPFGQAQFVETVAPTEDGGARKCPGDAPYLCDWTVSGGGAWINVIIESIFGVRAGLNQITAQPDFGAFDPKAELHNLRYQGKRYNVNKSGLREVGKDE